MQEGSIEKKKQTDC